MPLRPAQTYTFAYGALNIQKYIERLNFGLFKVESYEKQANIAQYPRIKKVFKTMSNHNNRLLKIRAWVVARKSLCLFRRPVLKIYYQLLCCLKYATNIQYRSHRRWLLESPDDQLRYRYDLPPDANILDLGGFNGDFAARFLERGPAQITIFEPLPTYATRIKKRFATVPSVMVQNAGLSDKDEQARFTIDGDATGAFHHSATGATVEVSLLDSEKFFKNCGVDEWHLAKLNIEGGEYALLRCWIEKKLIQNIKYLQVQFHLNVPNAKKQYNALAKDLQKTHRLRWRYPFIWESWERRD